MKPDPNDTLLYLKVHPVEGFLHIVLKTDDTIDVVCYWPFDLDNEDFVQITNTFSRSDYNTMLGELASAGEGRINALTSGFFSVKTVAGGLRIEITNQGKGALFKSIDLVFPASELPATA